LPDSYEPVRVKGKLIAYVPRSRTGRYVALQIGPFKHWDLRLDIHNPSGAPYGSSIDEFNPKFPAYKLGIDSAMGIVAEGADSFIEFDFEVKRRGRLPIYAFCLKDRYRNDNFFGSAESTMVSVRTSAHLEMNISYSSPPVNFL
jgi:hypothetical protein